MSDGLGLRRKANGERGFLQTLPDSLHLPADTDTVKCPASNLAGIGGSAVKNERVGDGPGTAVKLRYPH